MSWINSVFSSLYLLFIIGTILVLITENRSPAKTLIWVLLLAFLPVIGLILYLVFGRDPRKTRKQKVTYEQFVTDIYLNLCGEETEWIPSETIKQVPDRYKPFAQLLTRCNFANVWKGSDVEIITSGERKFDQLITDLENAAHHIHFEYFYFKADKTGKRIKEILMRKAREGVKVRFLYENVANIGVLPKYYYGMRDAGVEVIPFSKASLSWLHRQINYRNHRKIVVIDSSIGYTGGMNIGDEYHKEWRDTHLRILGQGVYGLQLTFLYDWYNSGGARIDYYPPYFLPVDNHSDNLMQVVPESPGSEWPYLLMAVTALVNDARDYLYIQTPYFMPSDSLLQALQTAVLRGVDVRIMLSRRSDFRFMDHATQAYYESSLRAGIKIYECQPTFIHSKTMVADDNISMIGSANMDMRSLELSFEINCFMYDKKLARENKNIFFDDLQQCVEIDLEQWREKPWRKKFLESVMKLISPLL